MESEGPAVGWDERRVESASGAEKHACEIQIRLNGEDRKVPANATIASLLADLKLPPDRVAVELDREIVRRGEWEGKRLHPGVAVEVVHFVGGG